MVWHKYCILVLFWSLIFNCKSSCDAPYTDDEATALKHSIKDATLYKSPHLSLSIVMQAVVMCDNHSSQWYDEVILNTILWLNIDTCLQCSWYNHFNVFINCLICCHNYNYWDMNFSPFIALLYNNFFVKGTDLPVLARDTFKHDMISQLYN